MKNLTHELETAMMKARVARAERAARNAVTVLQTARDKLTDADQDELAAWFDRQVMGILADLEG